MGRENNQPLQSMQGSCSKKNPITSQLSTRPNLDLQKALLKPVATMSVSLVFLQVLGSLVAVTVVRPLSSRCPALRPLPGFVADLFGSAGGSEARHVDGLRRLDIIASVVACLRGSGG